MLQLLLGWTKNSTDWTNGSPTGARRRTKVRRVVTFVQNTRHKFRRNS